MNNKKLSGDEIANVNFLRSAPRISSAPRKLPGFPAITQNNGHYAVQGHSRSPILVPIESSYTISDFLWVLNSNLPPILHRFPDITVHRSKIAIFGYPSCLTPPSEGFPWDDLREIFSGCQRMAKVPNAVEILPKIWTAWVRRTNVTDDRQTDGRAIAYSEREREFTFAKNYIIILSEWMHPFSVLIFFTVRKTD